MLSTRGTAVREVLRGAVLQHVVITRLDDTSAQGRELQLTATDRVGVYRLFVSYLKEHFGDDARGKSAAFYFLPWHFSFFSRYRALPDSVYGLERTLEHPLIAMRADVFAPEVRVRGVGLGAMWPTPTSLTECKRRWERRWTAFRCWSGCCAASCQKRTSASRTSSGMRLAMLRPCCSWRCSQTRTWWAGRRRSRALLLMLAQQSMIVRRGEGLAPALHPSDHPSAFHGRPWNASPHLFRSNPVDPSPALWQIV